MTSPASPRRPVPVFATIVVAAAVITMIALGIWQWQRRDEKLAFIAQIEANATRPATAFPRDGLLPPELLLRRSSVNCVRVLGWEQNSGRNAAGQSGLRHIATCQSDATAQPVKIVVGVADRIVEQPQFHGGLVNGVLGQAPVDATLMSQLGGHAPPARAMLVSTDAVPGLDRPALPDAQSIPNNHLAYAVQWFLFAGIALIIYALALRKRLAR